MLLHTTFFLAIYMSDPVAPNVFLPKARYSQLNNQTLPAAAVYYVSPESPGANLAGSHATPGKRSDIYEGKPIAFPGLTAVVESRIARIDKLLSAIHPPPLTK